MTPAERALAALVQRPLHAATSSVEVPGGVLVLTSDYPASHEHNKALITRPADAGEVLAAVERARADAGLGHVRLDVLPPADPGALADLAVAAGYARSHDVVMVLSPHVVPVPPPGAPAARELPWERVRDSVLASWEEELPGVPAVAVELADRRNATARAVDVRHLAAEW
jgi:hypothetical protein